MEADIGRAAMRHPDVRGCLPASLRGVNWKKAPICLIGYSATGDAKGFTCRRQASTLAVAGAPRRQLRENPEPAAFDARTRLTKLKKTPMPLMSARWDSQTRQD